jgi:hypothetical protein
VVHTNNAPLFTSGQRDRGKGLKSLAEDGNPASPGNRLTIAMMFAQSNKMRGPK